MRENKLERIIQGATGMDKESYRFENEEKLFGKETVKREMNVTSREKIQSATKMPPPHTS